jgi:hypothetical protein
VAISCFSCNFWDHTALPLYQRYIQKEYAMPSNFLCYAVPHNLLKSVVLVFFQALSMEIQRYSNVSCALTGYKHAGLIGSSICKNIIMG